jgi:hypothetical protein
MLKETPIDTVPKELREWARQNTQLMTDPQNRQWFQVEGEFPSDVAVVNVDKMYLNFTDVFEVGQRDTGSRSIFWRHVDK